MRIEDIPDKEFYAEYWRREAIKAKNQKALDKDMEEHRIFWLKSHGGTDGNDQCCNNYCRISCTGCDSYDHYDYDPNWKNKISNSPSYVKSIKKSNTKVNRRDQIIEQANKMLQQPNNKVNNSKTNNCPYSSNNSNNNSNSNYCNQNQSCNSSDLDYMGYNKNEIQYKSYDDENWKWCNRDIEPPDWLKEAYEQ